MADPTPMMAQYRRLKSRHREAILFFRLGDFYEMFEEDARTASKLLDLTLTQRNGVPMCGVPYHAATSYTNRLLRAGHKVAICEQKAGNGKELMAREVVEVVTPGTVVEEALLPESRNNYLLCLAASEGRIGAAYIDLSTGQFAATSFPEEGSAEAIRGEFLRLSPSELMVQETLLARSPALARIVSERAGLVVNRLPDWSLDWKSSADRLKRQLGVSSLHGLGFADRAPEVACAGAILEYLGETSRSLLPHVRSIRRYTESSRVGLNESTQRNLELVQSMSDGSTRYTLYEVLNRGKTAMGSRRLREWILAPLRDIEELERRLQVVELLYRNQGLLGRAREALGRVYDLERLGARIGVEKAHAKDLLAVAASIRAASEVALELERSPAPSAAGAPRVELFERLASTARALEDTRELVERSIHEEPSILLTEGGLIRRGWDAELDRLHELRQGSRAVLTEFVESEKRSTGIGSLKLRYNRVLGHFLEVTKANLGSVPPHYIRRQSLAGAERYTTEALSNIESELNSAEERIVEMEKTIFLGVRDKVRERVGAILDLADAVATLDVLASFAQTATAQGYSRPSLHGDRRLVIREGRHPVVEASLEGASFVPNDLELDGDRSFFVMLTGPNMAGKSTYLRQAALITLLAQIGSFVPAAEAQIGLVDSIFCRVGASDNLARGESTFLVEMSETAHILRTATRSSLLIFDEVGRGTSTRDGLAIARAVAVHIAERVGARTLFATHFHELTRFEHPAFRNYSMEVAEERGEVVFLKRVREGPADQSYGVHVAKLAGVPEDVIAEAERLLRLEGAPGAGPETAGQGAEAGAARARGSEPSSAAEPRGLFSPEELVLTEIRSAALDTLRPLDALNALARWKRELGGEEERPRRRGSR